MASLPRSRSSETSIEVSRQRSRLEVAHHDVRNQYGWSPEWSDHEPRWMRNFIAGCIPDRAADRLVRHPRLLERDRSTRRRHGGDARGRAYGHSLRRTRADDPEG